MGTISDAGRSPGDVMLRLAKLEREIRDLQTANRLESASLGSGGVRVHSGGSVRLQGGGSVQLEDGGHIVVNDGTVQVRDEAGELAVGMRRGPTGGQLVTWHPGGVASHMVVGRIFVGDQAVGQGFLIQQENGLDLINAFPHSETGKEQVRVFDHTGVNALHTDRAGLGLGRPYIEVPLYPTNSEGRSSRGDADDADTEQVIWQGRMWVTHPALHVQVRAWCGSSTTSTIRVYVGGDQLGAGIDVADTTAGFYDFGAQNLDLDQHPLYSYRNVQITLERTSGSGFVVVMPYGITKRGSV